MDRTWPAGCTLFDMQPASPRPWLDARGREEVLDLLADAARTCAAAGGLRLRAAAAGALLRRVREESSRAPEPRAAPSDRARARSARSPREPDREPTRHLRPQRAGSASAAIDRTG